jgi:catechol 2,3-dioxygenase-like lactoylglutathione lyase family enzyme
MHTVQSSRDVIIRTPAWNEAVRFYKQILGFAVSSRAESMMGFEFLISWLLMSRRCATACSKRDAL